MQGSDGSGDDDSGDYDNYDDDTCQSVGFSQKNYCPVECDVMSFGRQVLNFYPEDEGSRFL
jgi:hypothetical protein